MLSMLLFERRLSAAAKRMALPYMLAETTKDERSILSDEFALRVNPENRRILHQGEDSSVGILVAFIL